MSSKTADIWDVKDERAQAAEGGEGRAEPYAKVYADAQGNEFVIDSHVEVKNEELTEVGPPEQPERGTNPYRVEEAGAAPQKASAKKASPKAAPKASPEKK